jgi:RNA polymerase primary sigma factor
MERIEASEQLEQISSPENGHFEMPALDTAQAPMAILEARIKRADTRKIAKVKKDLEEEYYRDHENGEDAAKLMPTLNAAELKQLQSEDSDDEERAWIRKMLSKPVLTPEEEIYWFERHKLSQGDEREKVERELAESNQRLVFTIARDFAAKYRMPIIDLIQEGNVGLMTAIRKFDLARGYKFSTYATWWIRQVIHRYCMDRFSIMRIPIHVHEKKASAYISRIKLADELGHEPTEQEVIERAKMKPGDVARVNAALPLWHHTSLEASPYEDGGTTFAEIIPDKDVVSVERKVYVAKMGEALTAMMIKAGLTSRERLVLGARFGLKDQAVLTLEEIGKYFDLSRERVRQIENKGIKKLKRLARRFRANFVE